MTDRSLCGAGLKLNRHDFLRWALASLGTAWVSAAQAQNPGDGVLRVGVLAHYKPFSFFEGQLQGFDVDVLKIQTDRLDWGRHTARRR